MSKQKSVFTCITCEFQTGKWLGCCPECKSWNSFEEQMTSSTKKTSAFGNQDTPLATLTDLQSISAEHHERFLSSISEWDRVTGGGIVPGSFIIVTGDPGIGKSTLLLQLCAQLSQKLSVIYFSSEESLQQVKLRFDRIKKPSTQLLFSDQAKLETIIATCKKHAPHLVVIDSIQNIYNADRSHLPGSITQLKESAFQLMKLAKENNIAIIVTGHITKDGEIAGPKLLEHMVDAVFYLQKEDRLQTRILRSVKNRFGSINELGFFSMQSDGMHPIENINHHLLQDAHDAPGSIIISYLEGTRPLFLELQTLIVKTQFSVAQRVASGTDHKRIVLLAAILEKYLHIKFSMCDIFFKVSGGITIKHPSTDLGIALTLLSSYFCTPLPAKTIALGEISLTGHIKPVQHIDMHIKEAEKFGFQHIILAKNQKVTTKIKAQHFDNVFDLLRLFPEGN